INANPALLARANALFASQRGTGGTLGLDHPQAVHPAAAPSGGQVPTGARVGHSTAASKGVTVRPTVRPRAGSGKGVAARKGQTAHVEVREHRDHSSTRPISATKVSSLVGAKINLADRLSFQRAVGVLAPGKDVQSDKLTISFKYCLVRVDRPWLYQPLLYDRSWYMPG